MVKDKIITNETSELLLSHILNFYDNDEYMLNIFKVIGQEMDELINWVTDFENQSYPQFATFTLPYWEESLRLEIDDNLSIEQRRGRITTKLGTYFPITKQRLESIASAAAGTGVTIQEFIADYTFGVDIKSSDLVDTISLFERINEVKPAHLSYIVTVIASELIGKVYTKTYTFPYHYQVTSTFNTDQEKGIGANTVAPTDLKTYNFKIPYPITGTFFCSRGGY